MTVRDAVLFGFFSSICLRRFWRRIFPVLVASAVVIIPVIIGCDKHEAKKPEAKATEVTALKVTLQDVPIVSEYIAQTQSSREVSINARVNGFLDRWVYREGTMVKEGQVLFLMDPKPFKAQLDQAKAALAMQEASLATARANLARVQPLTALNALSKKDLDDATGQFQTAAAAVEQAKAQVQTAKLNLSYTTIFSPVDGITSYAKQAEGTYINEQNSQLTTVAVLSPMWVNFSLSENQMRRFHDEIEKKLVKPPTNMNFEVKVILIDGTEFPYTGRITFAEPSYNSQTGTFLLRVSVKNPQGVLRPNQYVKVRLFGATRPKAILVPQRAVQQGSKGQIVWVVNKKNQVELRPVTVGDWHGDDWFINEGLEAGDLVVVDGGLTLRPGAVVSVKPHVPKATATPTPTPPGSCPPPATTGGKTTDVKNGK
ncbi:MAG: efflux RND transporter periplasmic adaptor subunit [Deltaproteobacteria bacterium]|nr:efflux RND transporter periplasmic adaptor subunit [Deltaproteobacteria bacterium]